MNLLMIWNLAHSPRAGRETRTDVPSKRCDGNTREGELL